MRLTTMRKRRWSELTAAQRGMIITLGLAQVGLAAAAWGDLARRPREQVNGPKRLWASVIAINFFGPVAYFTWGRRVDPPR